MFSNTGLRMPVLIRQWNEIFDTHWRIGHFRRSTRRVFRHSNHEFKKQNSLSSRCSFIVGGPMNFSRARAQWLRAMNFVYIKIAWFLSKKLRSFLERCTIYIKQTIFLIFSGVGVELMISWCENWVSNVVEIQKWWYLSAIGTLWIRLTKWCLIAQHCYRYPIIIIWIHSTASIKIIVQGFASHSHGGLHKLCIIVFIM